MQLLLIFNHQGTVHVKIKILKSRKFIVFFTETSLWHFVLQKTGYRENFVIFVYSQLQGVKGQWGLN